MPPARPPTPLDVARLQGELDRAVKLHQGGKTDEAEELYMRILDEAPGQPDALNLLGVIQSEKNKNDRALDLLSRAARLRPKDPNILNNLGRASVRARRFEQAIDSLEHALSLSPNLTESLGNLIQAHRQAGNLDEAEYFINALREKKGGSLTADVEHARLLSDLGKKDEARELLLKIIKYTPQHAFAWQALAKLSKIKPGDPIIDGIVDAISKAKEPSSQMRVLCYTAGKVFDDLGEYDRAFEYFSRAKKQDPHTFNAERASEYFKNIADVFNANFFAGRKDWGVSSKRPVFIVGMPRSGTTLAEQILASHPDVYGGGELEFVGQLTASIRDYVPSGRYPSATVALSRETVASFAFRYLRKIGAIDQLSARFTDKMPHNFLSLGFLRIMFQNLRVVHCIRNPADTILSCFQHDFAQTHDYNQSLEGLTTYYVLYRELMEHWSGVAGDCIHPLHYEKMVENQEDQSRALVSFTGLEWDQGVLAFAQNERRVSTPSSWQVRNPLYSSSSGRWRNYERHLAPVIEHMPARFLP
ncbi:MAG TPA: sulfotransferase [Candidatus Binatia bacterium]|nr:sulfotransferase [Candidatus Binatia bacterium]